MSERKNEEGILWFVKTAEYYSKKYILSKHNTICTRIVSLYCLNWTSTCIYIWTWKGLPRVDEIMPFELGIVKECHIFLCGRGYVVVMRDHLASQMPGMAFPVWMSLCSSRMEDWLNLALHTSHWNPSSLVWVRLCFLRLEE